MTTCGRRCDFLAVDGERRNHKWFVQQRDRKRLHQTSWYNKKRSFHKGPLPSFSFTTAGFFHGPLKQTETSRTAHSCPPASQALLPPVCSSLCARALDDTTRPTGLPTEVGVYSRRRSGCVQINDRAVIRLASIRFSGLDTLFCCCHESQMAASFDVDGPLFQLLLWKLKACLHRTKRFGVEARLCCHSTQALLTAHAARVVKASEEGELSKVV